ncbi:uncharacterized protein A1O9_01129 [Exophiala aquamarina CBS 119918]|uniref:Uncharacterized protein n=1 Tax=Exophiala aquamarina CBS 119918 TaxID=1182545 RepID=A0A072PUW8_9EURO|nr:uncharacterized protein A1O9_01129 [Exophiala aquamarina CBS 119918]KEF63153.1 hypothetical protein A1O9_01129 [Exophiala aquamarina CBS 119918]
MARRHSRVLVGPLTCKGPRRGRFGEILGLWKVHPRANTNFTSKVSFHQLILARNSLGANNQSLQHRSTSDQLVCGQNDISEELHIPVPACIISGNTRPRIQRALAPKQQPKQRRKNLSFFCITALSQLHRPPISAAGDEDDITSLSLDENDVHPSAFLYHIGSHGQPTADGHFQPFETDPEAKAWLSS